MDRFAEQYQDPWLQYRPQHTSRCIGLSSVALTVIALLQMCTSGIGIAFAADAIINKFYLFVAAVVSIALQILGLFVALTRCESREKQLTAVSEHRRAAG